MAGEIAKLYAKIGVDSKEFERGMKNVKNELNLGSQAFKAMAAVVSVQTVRALADYTVELAKVAAEHKRLDTSFRQLSKAPDAMLAAMKKASSGTISETQMILAANRAMLLGISQDAEQLGKLMEVARFRGRAMGLSTQQAFSDIVTGLGRMSPLILDNLGITINAEQTFSDYAQSIGKAASALSDAEKKQALLNRVLSEGQNQIAAAGGIADDTADKFEEMSAKVEDLKVKLGEVALKTGVIEIGVDFVVNGVEGINTAFEAMAAIDAWAAANHVTTIQAIVIGLGGQPIDPSTLDMPAMPTAMAPTIPADATPAERMALEAAYKRQIGLGIGGLERTEYTGTGFDYAAEAERIKQSKLQTSEQEQKDLQQVARDASRWAGLATVNFPLTGEEKQKATMARIATSYEVYQRRMALATDKTSVSIEKQKEALDSIAGLTGVEKYNVQQPGAGFGFMGTLTDPDIQDKTTNFLTRIAEENQRNADKQISANTRVWNDFEDKARRAWDAIAGFADMGMRDIPKEQLQPIYDQWGFGGAAANASGVSGGLSAIGMGPDIGPIVEKAKAAVKEALITEDIRAKVAEQLTQDPATAAAMKRLGIDVDAAVKDVGERQIDVLKSMKDLTNVNVVNWGGSSGAGGGGGGNTAGDTSSSSGRATTRGVRGVVGGGFNNYAPITVNGVQNVGGLLAELQSITE